MALTSPHPVVRTGILVAVSVTVRRQSSTAVHTVSTHRSMSLMNLDDAPKARKTPTPAMVSPYNEYRGERVTESVAKSAPFLHPRETPVQHTQSSHIPGSLPINLGNLVV
jgi:hypothetical protein